MGAISNICGTEQVKNVPLGHLPHNKILKDKIKPKVCTARQNSAARCLFSHLLITDSWCAKWELKWATKPVMDISCPRVRGKRFCIHYTCHTLNYTLYTLHITYYTLHFAQEDFFGIHYTLR